MLTEEEGEMLRLCVIVLEVLRLLLTVAVMEAEDERLLLCVTVMDRL